MIKNILMAACTLSLVVEISVFSQRATSRETDAADEEHCLKTTSDAVPSSADYGADHDDCEAEIVGPVALDETVSSFYFSYPGQKICFLYSSPRTEYIKLNYSGPAATVKQFYTTNYNTGSYLTSVPNILQGIDMFLVGENRDYYFEFSAATSQLGPWSIDIESVVNNPSAYSTYVLKQSFDSTSPIGYHYSIDNYPELDNSNYVATPASFINHDPTSYFYGIDDDHKSYRGQSGNEGWEDERRAVINTSSSEYSAIAYASDEVHFKPIGASGVRVPITKYFRSSGTFISQTSVATCAHAFYNHLDPTTNQLGDFELPYRKYFYPGINSYGRTNDYYEYFGQYRTTEALISVSYWMAYESVGEYSGLAASYDWALCTTVPVSNNLPSHSCFGITAFNPGTNSFPYASFAGYGTLQESLGEWQYNRLQWTSRPDSVVTIETNDDGSKYLLSSEITNSGGHSGGPLYFYSASVTNGQTVYECRLIGITGGLYYIPPENSNDLPLYVSALFYKLNPFFVNLAQEYVL